MLSIANASCLGDVKLEYCWRADEDIMCVRASDASPKSKDCTNIAMVRPGFPDSVAALYGTVPYAEVVGASVPIAHANPNMHHYHFVDAT